jgi:hypothetical protein
VNLPHVHVSQSDDDAVCKTDGVHLDAFSAEPNEQSETLKPKAKVTALRHHLLFRWKLAVGARLPGYPVTCPSL